MTEREIAHCRKNMAVMVIGARKAGVSGTGHGRAADFGFLLRKWKSGSSSNGDFGLHSGLFDF
jgi:hypothetical protein